MLPAKLHLRCAVYLHEVNLFKKLGCVTGPGCTKRNSTVSREKFQDVCHITRLACWLFLTIAMAARQTLQP